MTADAADAPLPAEVRQRLMAIAADLIGHRPAAELPPSVRRFARFAPAKRVRMGGTEIAAALAADDAFRAAVGEIVVQSSPELMAQILAGTPPSTADPTDIGVISFLLRPDGWQDLLAAATATLAQQAEHRTAGLEADRLRAEVSRLSAVNAELARARDAAKLAARTKAGEQSREIADLQHRLRTLTGELRAAQREAYQASAELAAIREEAERAITSDMAELRKARSRISVLEAELDTGRRTAKAGRDHNDARLWVLLEQLRAVSTGLRRELDIDRPNVTPADSVAATTPGHAARPATADGSLLDRLLDGAHVHLIVDGYNLTKTGYPAIPLAAQRSRLVSSLGALTARTGVEITVAFDGTAAPTGSAASLPTPRGVRVLFSAPGELADDLIRQLLLAEPEGRTVVVASSDGAVAASARGIGAWSVPAAVLLARIERS